MPFPSPAKNPAYSIVSMCGAMSSLDQKISKLITKTEFLVILATACSLSARLGPTSGGCNCVAMANKDLYAMAAFTHKYSIVGEVE